MIYICVLNYKNPGDTIKCCDSLLKLQEKNYRILLVDNASPDDSVNILSEYTQKYTEKIVFFASKINLGYAGGNNVALRYAMEQTDCEYVWVLNNDTLVDPSSLSWLIDFMEKHPRVGLCGSKLVYSWDHSKVQGYGGKYNRWLGVSSTFNKEKDIPHIDFVIGAAVFVRRSFLEQVGLMNEEYFLYFEELDWAQRAKGKFLLGCEPRSIVYHKEGASIGANAKRPEDKSELADYYSMRNRLLFTKKFFPECLLTVYMSSVVMLWNRLRRHQYRRVWSYIKLLLGIKDEKFEPRIK